VRARLGAYHHLVLTPGKEDSVARPTVHKNAPLLRYLAAALFAASVATLLRGSSFYPAWSP
jgi:hypothetical protein